MRCPTLSELPPPPQDKTGWPWTEESPQLPDTMPDPSTGSLWPCSGQAGQVASWPRVGIVTPSYNQGQFLQKTILSVLNQDYPNLEYIIIDGGSTDGSVDIIRKYEDRLAFWVSEPDRGQADAINKGFEQATGSIFAWLNSDDLLEPSAVSLAVYSLMRYPDVGMVYGDRTMIDARSNVLGHLIGGSFRLYLFRAYMAIPQETVFFRRDLFYEVGGLDESLEFVFDLDLWCRMQRVAKIRHLPAFMGRYREHSQAKSYDFTLPVPTPLRLRFVRERNQVYQRYFVPYKPACVSRLIRAFELLRRQLERRAGWYGEEVAAFRKVREEGFSQAVASLHDERNFSS